MGKLHQNDVLYTKAGIVRLTGTEHRCPACGSRKGGKVRFPFESYSIMECAQCGTMHLDPLPDDEALKAIYNTNYYKDTAELHGYRDYATEKERIKKTYRKRLRFVKKLLGAGASPQAVHEIGCAFGYGLEEAKMIFECPVSGSDISTEAVSICRGAGMECCASDGAGTFEAGQGAYDLVYAFDVIEHLKDIGGFAEWLHTTIAANGYFALTTPDMDSLFNKLLGGRTPSIKIPQHIVYFTTQTLVDALKGEFKLIGHAPDYQYIPLHALWVRVKHILNVPIGMEAPAVGGLDILIPTGMKIYVFQKIG